LGVGVAQNALSLRLLSDLLCLTDDRRANLLRCFNMVVLAQNRRVDIRLNGSDDKSNRRYPFNAADSATLLDLQWVISSVRSEKFVDLDFPGTYLTRFHVNIDDLEFVQLAARKNPQSARSGLNVSERIESVQQENLQRLDDDIAVLTKYLMTQDAPKGVLEVLETLSNEQHASWQSAVDRIEELMGDKE
jgi:hypothetical protein